MNNLSNDEIKDQILILEETCVPGESDAFSLRALRELLAYREAAANSAAVIYRNGREARVCVIGTDLPNGYSDVYTAPPLPVVPDGWALVPIEPTKEMMLHKSECQHHVWDDHDCAMRQTRRLVWANMIAAAPKPPAQVGSVVKK